MAAVPGDKRRTTDSFHIALTAIGNRRVGVEVSGRSAGSYVLSRASPLSSAAAGEGLHFRFDLARRGNTFDAHRLLHLALPKGMQDRLKERLDHATFSEGLPVSDHARLMQVATEAGLDEIEVKEVLTSDMYADAVRADEAQARAYGISAVPFFVIDGRYGIAGAQPAATLVRALERAWNERIPLTVLDAAEADACADGSCEP